MDYNFSTVSFGSIYGPAAGQAVSDRASENPMTNIAGGRMFAGLSIPALVALGILSYWLVKTYD